MGYEEYLSEQLFAPAGMTQTGYVLPDWRPDQVAVEYDAEGVPHGRPFEHPWADDGPYWNLRGNGGLLSTAGDMFRWHRALEGEQVLDARAKEELFEPRVLEEPGGGTYYGYGWVVQDSDDGRILWHNGGNGWSYGEIARAPDAGAMVFWATNQVRSTTGTGTSRAWGRPSPVASSSACSRRAEPSSGPTSRQPDWTIRKRFPSGSRKKNWAGTGSGMVTSSETSPPAPAGPAISASTSTPPARRAAWSASMSSVKNAQYAASTPAGSPRSTRQARWSWWRRVARPRSIGCPAVLEVDAILEPELVDIERQGPLLVGHRNEHGPDLGDPGGFACRASLAPVWLLLRLVWSDRMPTADSSRRSRATAPQISRV